MFRSQGYLINKPNTNIAGNVFSFQPNIHFPMCQINKPEFTVYVAFRIMLMQVRSVCIHFRSLLFEKGPDFLINLGLMSSTVRTRTIENSVKNGDLQNHYSK